MSNTSQGSVATCLRSGGIVSDGFIKNFLLSVTVKEFQNRSASGEVTSRSTRTHQ